MPELLKSATTKTKHHTSHTKEDEDMNDLIPIDM